jgi:serine/threonine protein kinase
MTESIAPESRLLVGRYRFDRQIGRGGMGSVWAAHDEILGRDVAIKEVIPPPDLTPEQRRVIRERTLREARAAARIAHPSAVTVYDVVEEDGHPYIVMQLLPPHTLADVLLRDGPLPPERVARIGLDLVSALEAAHRAGVLHRDVKPANVLLPVDGPAVLTDFGIASVDSDPTLTATGMLVGSPAYMPPERARGDRPTPAADLWSLGATLFAAVEGEPPFRREGQLQTLNAVLTEPVPPAVHAGPLRPVIEALLTRDPAHRPTAERSRELLEQALADADAPDADTQSTVPVDVGPTVEALPLPPPPPARPGASARPAPSAPARVQPPEEPTVPGGSAPPSAPTPPPDRSPQRRGRRRAVLATVAVLVLVPAGAAAIHLVGDRGTPSAGGTPSATRTPPAAGASSTATTSTGPVAPASTATRTASSPAPSSGSSGSAHATKSGTSVPAGFRRYTDPTGFSLAIPTGWNASRKGSDVTFRAPGSRAYLLVPQTTKPQPDALVDWQQQERAASPRFNEYQRIRLERVAGPPGWDVADWEFRWTASSGRLHVLDRNLRVSNRRAYALYWSVPDQQWAQMRPTFAVIADSFRPAT